MFPSQRGNFFPVLNPAKSRSNGTKTKPSASSNRNQKASSKRNAVLRQLQKNSRFIQDGRTLSLISTTSILDRNSFTRSSEFPMDRLESTPSPTVRYEQSRSKRKLFELEGNMTQILLKRIPSQATCFNFGVSEEDISCELKLRPFRFGSSSMASNVPSRTGSRTNRDPTKLPTKTEQERDLVKKLCENALMKLGRDDRRVNEVSDTTSELLNYDPRNHKGRLHDFMLKMVQARQKLLDERRANYTYPRKSVVKENEPRVPEFLPVFSIFGRVMVGKEDLSVKFPNTFANLSDLHNPQNDPKGFRRYSTLVDMKDFEDSEIYLRIYASACLRIDGVHTWSHDESANQKTPLNSRIVSVYVELPLGVYPEHLRIGRSSDGIMVIQECWKF